MAGTRGMRLRTLLLLAVTVPFASRRIEVTFARELAARADSAARLASAELDRLRAEVDQAVSACAADPLTESVALQLESGLPPAADAMRGVAEGRPLTVLTLRDASGVSRSSAFLPARVGDVEPGLSAVRPARWRQRTARPPWSADRCSTTRGCHGWPGSPARGSSCRAPASRRRRPAL